MKKPFGSLSDGRMAFLYTITSGKLTAVISDYGATLIKLLVPDRNGILADVVLGFDDPNEYTASNTFFGATIGRNSNRIKNAAFILNGRLHAMTPNDHACNNLHSGPNYFKDRLWTVEYATETSIRLYLESPHGDQGFPGRAVIRVTYTLEQGTTLRICYDAVSDQDTIFNPTNHSYFNLAGHDHPEKAMDQVLTMPARFFHPSDSESIPTGELRSVAGTPMDFRTPKPIRRDIACVPGDTTIILRYLPIRVQFSQTRYRAEPWQFPPTVLASSFIPAISYKEKQEKTVFPIARGAAFVWKPNSGRMPSTTPNGSSLF